MASAPSIADLPLDDRVRMAEEATQHLHEHWSNLPTDQLPEASQIPEIYDRVNDHFGIAYDENENIIDLFNPTDPIEILPPQPLPTPEPTPEPEISDRDPADDAEKTECGFWCVLENIGIGIAKGIVGAAIGVAVAAALVFVGVPAAVLTTVGTALGAVGVFIAVYVAATGTLQDACQVLGELIVGLGLPGVMRRILRGIPKWGQTKPTTEPKPKPPAEKPTVDEPPPKSPGDDPRPQPGPRPPKLPKRIEELAKDPLNKNRVSPKSIKEAEVGAGLESRGRVPGPLKRDPSGAGEFIDAKGQTWDVKGFNSQFKNGFKINEAITKIEGEMMLGENVMVDTRNMSAEHVNQLAEAALGRGWGGRVVFYP